MIFLAGYLAIGKLDTEMMNIDYDPLLTLFFMMKTVKELSTTQYHVHSLSLPINLTDMISNNEITVQ